MGAGGDVGDSSTKGVGQVDVGFEHGNPRAGDVGFGYGNPRARGYAQISKQWKVKKPKSTRRWI